MRQVIRMRNGFPKQKVGIYPAAKDWSVLLVAIVMMAVCCWTAGEALAQGAGLYKDGEQVLNFDEAFAPLLSSLGKATPTARGTGRAIKQQLIGAGDLPQFVEQNNYFAEVMRCRELIFTLTTDDGTITPAAADLQELFSSRDQLITANEILLTKLVTAGKYLTGQGYPSAKIERHQAFLDQHQIGTQGLLDALSRIEAAANTENQDALTTALQSGREFFSDNFVQPDPPLLNARPAVIPLQPKPPPSIQRADLIQPGLISPLAKMEQRAGYDPDDLAENIDVQFTPEITALAAELNHSPLEIFQYVYNNVTFEAYLGSRKGAPQTLVHHRGNDYDQASLLIALLRVSGYPARYARGLVEMPIEQVTNWVGLESPQSAATLLNTAGFQVTMINDPLPVALRCRRVWVEAYLPLANYRGAVKDSAGKSWVQLDPAFKQYSYQQTIDILAEIDFDVDVFMDDHLSQFYAATPAARFRELLLDSLEFYHPGVLPEELIRQRELLPLADEILAGTLPYLMLSREENYATIPINQRYYLRFHMYDGAGMDLDYTTSVPEIVLKQVTISYIGATPADQQIIDDAGGIFNVLQPWTVDLKPVLKIDGCVVATGAGSIMMGMLHNSEMHFTPPVGASTTLPLVANQIIAGNYQGIGIDTEDAYPAELTPPPTSCPEDLLGQVLHQTALTYVHTVDLAGGDVADLMHMVITNDISEAIVENTIRVLYSGGLPTTFEWTGMVVDADRKIVGSYSSSGAAESIDLMRVSGADGSIQENQLFETLFGEEAVSTIKIIQLANDSGITVLNVTPGNIGSLTHPAGVIAAVQSAINIGRNVLIPRDPLTYYDWTGTGWIDLDPSDGAAGYLISGGHGGGATVEEWPLSYPDLICLEAIGPVEVQPAAPGDLYCWENDAKLIFTVPTIKYWGLDDEGECVLLHSERKEFPLSRTIRQIATIWGPGVYTFRAGEMWLCGCIYIEKEITIGKLDLTIYRPYVIDPKMKPIPDAAELALGAQTFVNLDNDDQDGFFDTGTGDVIVSGEDEMCYLELRIQPASLTLGTAMLEAFGGTAQIKLWRSINKEVEYIPGTPLNVATDFRPYDGDSRIYDLWAEGIGPHTQHPGVKFKMSSTQLPNCGDWVALTVIGIEQINWMGKNNSRHDDNNLDDDPNWPGGLGRASARVFPGARHSGMSIEAKPRDKVDVKVHLSVGPVEPLKIYFRSFDVDDPTTAVDPLDDETTASGEDNRGTTIAKEGAFPGSVGNIKEQLFTSDEATFEFQVTMQPGDNFRIVGNGDRNFLQDLENADDKQGPDNANKQRIVNTKIPGTNHVQREIRDADHYASRALTVWRKLHIEFDSMGDVVNNSVADFIISLNTGNSADADEVWTSATLRDGSKDLDSGSPENGRFEKGTINIAGTHSVVGLTGNGMKFVRKVGGLNVCAQPLPFSSLDNDWWGNSSMSGFVTQITGGSKLLWLNITSQSDPAIDWPDFVGGTIKIGSGPTMGITAVDAANKRVTVGSLIIPCVISDDDSPEFTDVPDPDLSVLETAYKPAYILPLQDIGQHQGNTTFLANIKSSADADVREGWKFDWQAHEANNNFWIVYVRGAFQFSTDSDRDPDFTGAGGEGATLGIVDNLGPPLSRGQGANIFIEVFRNEPRVPDPAKGLTEAHTVAHEVGHVMGGYHGDCIPPDASPCASAGLMAQTWLRTSPHFNRISLNKYRSLDHP